MNPKPSDSAQRLRSRALMLGRVAISGLLGALLPAWAQLPYVQLQTAFPLGGKPASAFELTVTGSNMEGVDRLFFSHPGIKGSPLMGKSSPFQPIPRPVPGKFTVSIASDVSPGVYELRVVGRYGISNPRSFMVGDQEEIVSQAGNHDPPSAREIPVGVTINGSSHEDAADFFRFKARKGQRVTLDTWAQRLDSKMDATLVLYDASGQELQSNRDTYRLDPFLDFLVPADGHYLVKIYDFLYRGGPEYAYRLSVGTQPHIDYIFPPAGLPGSRQTYKLYGQNLPGSEASRVLNAHGVPLEEKVVEIVLPEDAHRLPSNSLLEPNQITVHGVDYRLSSAKGTSNSVGLGFATAPVTQELEPNNQPHRAQKISLPCEVNGQFFPQADEDWFTFEVKGGSSYWIEVFSHRLGLPTDPAVILQRLALDAQGQERKELVMESDDGNSYLGDERYNLGSRDPLFKFKAAEDGIYRLNIHDLSASRHSRPSHLYRLSIRQSRPDFHLLVVTRDPGGSNDDAIIWQPLIRRGGKTRMNVIAIRRDGFTGAIKLEVKGLPPGIRWSRATVPADSNGTFIGFEASEETAGWAGTLQLIGRARINGKAVAREARHASLVWNAGSLRRVTPHSRLVRNLTLAVSQREVAPQLPELRIEQQEWDVALEGDLKIPFQITDRSRLPGELKLRLGDLSGLRETTTKLVVDDKTSEGTLEYRVTNRGNEFKPGKYTFSAVALGEVTYRNQPEEVPRAYQEKVRLEQLTRERMAQARSVAGPGNRAEMAAQARAAERARRDAEKRLREAISEAAPRKVSVATHSRALDLTIHPAPITLAAQQVPVALQPGARLEVPVSIERLFEYADPVEIGLKVPTHIAGIRAETVTIPKGKTKAALIVQLSPDLKPGDYQLKVEAKLQLNERDLQVEEPMTIQVRSTKGSQQRQTLLKPTP